LGSLLAAELALSAWGSLEEVYQNPRFNPPQPTLERRQALTGRPALYQNVQISCLPSDFSKLVALTFILKHEGSTPGHYLPLLYVFVTWQGSEPITFPVEGVDGGSISMLAEKVG
jgi:hypothetical protein